MASSQRKKYWEDLNRSVRVPVPMPYAYIVEALCDEIAAGMVYQGKEWSKQYPLEYWNQVEKNTPVEKHPYNIAFMESVFQRIAEKGLKEGLDKKYLKKEYGLIFKQK